jgi:hypothetical protein
MDIEWWEIAVAIGVAAGLMWMTTRKVITLGLNNTPHGGFPAHSEARGSLRFEGAHTIDQTSMLERAHKHSFKSRRELEKSDRCGCFYCEETFPPSAITEWVDDGHTAMCPFCGIDSVLGSASGLELSKDFLHRMNERWFS